MFVLNNAFENDIIKIGGEIIYIFVLYGIEIYRTTDKKNAYEMLNDFIKSGDYTVELWRNGKRVY